MTDNIRIHIEDNYHPPHPFKSAHISITPEIARQIVALGSLPALYIPNGSLAAKLDWSAPVESCGIYRASDGTDQCSLTTAQPAGDDEVNGLYDESVKRHWMEYHNEKVALIADLRAKLAEAEKDRDSWRAACNGGEKIGAKIIAGLEDKIAKLIGPDGRSYVVGVEAERDKALELLRKVHPLLSRSWVNLDIMRDIEVIIGKP